MTNNLCQPADSIYIYNSSWAADTVKEVSSVGYANSCTCTAGNDPSAPRLKSQIPTEKSRGVSDLSVMKPRTQNSINSTNFRTVQNYCIKSNYQIIKVLLHLHTRTDPTPLSQASVPNSLQMILSIHVFSKIILWPIGKFTNGHFIRGTCGSFIVSHLPFKACTSAT
jgi:hypothetical protein